MQEINNSDQIFLDKFGEFPGISDVKQSGHRESDDGLWQSKGNFKYKNLTLSYGLTRSKIINFYYFNLGFEFKLKKETVKTKIFECINSFNEQRPGIKACLELKKGKMLSLSFSYELAGINDEHVTNFIFPALDVLVSAPIIFYLDATNAGLEMLSPQVEGD
ncbi:MAG TPA: hypothetical protein DC039_08315 [Leclercia adecarboxylata]|nr:hypothetical protein [Leclercia adecarboxylata]